ncbi:hypothetical protein DL346_03665 [Paenibacillus montanisoli]|uniref:Uncharacterized protein n=2 Tax=Paenibacillus montanisoli TaxID=2081970 RepID=A0A328UC51_9BACL|nr:hypothetical protein DL346_03665 [Paenibacillus montanisoli]
MLHEEGITGLDLILLDALNQQEPRKTSSENNLIKLSLTFLGKKRAKKHKSIEHFRFDMRAVPFLSNIFPGK